MKSIKFLGASGFVTGSGYLVSPNKGKDILVDLGMFQGTDDVTIHNNDPFDVNVSNLEAAFLTHAHLDHCGRLPILIQNNFNGFVYMTEATKELAEIVIMDSARIQEKDQDQPIYTTKDAIRIINHFKTVKYGEAISAGSFKAVFRDAGHIIGSSSIEITEVDTSEKIVFSGDLGNSPQDIEKPTEYINEADYVVMESTYGDKEHGVEDPRIVIQNEINTIEKTGGTLLIPSFSIERTQVLLHIINYLKNNGKISQEIPIFMDSPMARQATNVYKKYKHLYNQELKDQSKKEDPFAFPGLVEVRSHKQSMAIARDTGPKVIIAGSGMMSGGRILNHAKHFLNKEDTRLLIVGYQAVETIGREILEGAKTVKIDDEEVNIRATVTDITTLSAHADQQNLFKWISHIKGVKKVFLTHGEELQRETLKKLIQNKLNIKEVFLPKIGEELNL